MKRLLSLAALLLAGCASRPAPRAALDVTCEGRAPVQLGGPVLVEGGRGGVGAAVLPPSDVEVCEPRCAFRGNSTVRPDATRAECYMQAALTWCRGAVLRGELTHVAGPEIALSVLRRPFVVYGACPVYITGTTVGGEVITTCAAGVAYPTWIRVSLAEEARILPLHPWEETNSYVCYWLGLWSLADGWPASQATEYARGICG